MKIKIVLLLLFLNACVCYSQTPMLQGQEPEMQDENSWFKGENSWLEGKGEILLSPYVSHYYTDTKRDEDGNKSDFDNNGFYENYTYKLYFSTALISRKLSLIGTLPYVKSTYSDDFTLDENSEFGDIELGVTMHLKNLGKYHYLTGSFTTIIPGYKNDEKPFTGFGKVGNELRINVSGNSEWMGINDNFHQLSLSAKKFYDGGPLQLKLYGTQGYRITEKFLVLGSLEVLMSRGDDFTVSQNNIQVTTDFDYVKATLNLGYEFNPKFALYAGGFTDLWDRNVSIGRGWQIFSVIKL
ncbi:hypothetical protein ACFFVB_05025 [Formosa undariae]|uniref:Transporter n=1 Tax=Formosa undariae TaxID=1325436 RepID=A0ABV5EZ24_9FLAO